MSGLGLVIFCGEAAKSNVETIAAAARRMDFSVEERVRDFESSLRDLGEFVVAPDIVVMDVSAAGDPMAAVARIGEAAIDSEFDLILTGVPNDARLYRRLRALSVSDVFDETPEDDEVSLTLTRILESRETLIDLLPGKVTYVWSTCGGAGGTSVAVAVARRHVDVGRRTLLIDLDTVGGAVSFAIDHVNGARETPALVEALVSPDRVDALFLNRAVFSPERNLSYLSVRHDSAIIPAEGALGSLIKRAQASFDMVVVDIPWRGQIAPYRREIVGLNVIVVNQTPASLLGYGAIRRMIDASGSSADVAVLVNRFKEASAAPILPADFSDKTSEIVLAPYDANAMAKASIKGETMFSAPGKLGRAMKEFDRRFIAGKKKKPTLFASIFSR